MKTIREIAEQSFLNAVQLKKVEEIMLADGFYPVATLRREEVVRIDFQTEHENDALYLVEEDNRRGVEIEQRIEDKYPHYRLQSYRTLRKARGLQHLRSKVVYEPH